MKHYGNVTKINGAEVEPYPIAVTVSRFGGMEGAGIDNKRMAFKSYEHR